MSPLVRYTLALAACVVVAAVVIALVWREPSAQEEFSTVRIGGQMVRVVIADTPALRARGLSGRGALAPDEGMLFVFEEDGLHTFWMKDMRFAIDILWISREGVVVDIRQNVAPETYPATFAPRREARYAIELPTGFVEAHAVQEGDALLIE